MKKLLLMGVFVLIISASARQKPPRHIQRETPETGIASGMTHLSHDVAELDSTLTILKANR